MPPLPFPKTWILVADASQAAVWDCASRDGPLAVIPDFHMAAVDTHGFSRDLKSDKPGRSFTSSGDRRAAMQPPHDPHDLAKARFMAEVAERLSVAAREARFARLIVMAPPRMLGILRKELTETARRMIAGEVDKDLTKATPDAILDHARDYLHAA